MNYVCYTVYNMKTWTPEEIKAFRKRLNLYQREFADLLGVTREYVICLEKGVRTPSKSLRLFLDCLKKQLKGKKKKRG